MSPVGRADVGFTVVRAPNHRPERGAHPSSAPTGRPTLCGRSSHRPTTASGLCFRTSPSRKPAKCSTARQVYLGKHSILTPSAGLRRDWRGNSEEFYSAQLFVAACQDLSLAVTSEPDLGHPDPNDDNPHHGAIHGLVELFYNDRNSYDIAITRLAKAAEVLPECLPEHIRARTHLQ